MSTVKVLFAGDFCIRHSGVEHMNDKEIPFIAAPIKEVTEKYDISVVNVETVFTDNPTPTKKSGPNISSPVKALDLLLKMGFSVGAFANNHVMDQGYEQGRASYEMVKEGGMACIGFGKNVKEAYEPYRTTVKGKKISIFNFAEHEFVAATEFEPGFAPIDFIENAKLIREEKKNADVVLVYLHAGNEHCPYPREGVLKYTHALADEGADAIVISHPHCVQGTEVYNGVPIAYSMGNFFMAKRVVLEKETSTWNIGYMSSLEIDDNNKVSLEIIPYEFGSDCSYFKLLDGSDKEAFLAYIDRLSKFIVETPKQEYEKFKHAWSVEYIRDAKKDYLDLFLTKEEYKEDMLYYIRNCFSCETHAEVLLDYYVLKTEGRLDDYEEYIEILRDMQKRPF